MTDIPTVTGRPETEWEKGLGDWFKKQSLLSLDALEAAARTILSLVTALLGLLLGVLAVTEDPLPAYFELPVVRWLGVGAVAALLAALAGTLGVLLPQQVQVAGARPDKQAQAFARLLAQKSRWLTAAVIGFGLGLVALGAVLIIALVA